MTTRTWAMVGVMLVLLFAAQGCGLFDRAAGLDPKTGERVAPPGQAPIEVLGKLVSPFVPGADTIALGLAGIWAMLRGRRWKKIATTGMETISEAKRGKLNIADIVGLWARKQDAEKIRWYARGLVHKIEARQ